MKKNRGRSFFFFLLGLCASGLMGSEYQWSAYINKTKAMSNEAIYLEYICEFEDRGELYTIEFHPVGENEIYDLRLLGEDTSYKDGKRSNRYAFVAFVKKAQKVDFAFDMVMKKTTQDSIDNTIIGRDNAQFVDYTSKYMRQKVLSVDVEDSKTDLVGSFTLQREFSSPKVKAYEPFHLSISLKGEGNLQNIKAFDLNISGVRVFAQEPQKEFTLSKEGFLGSYTQKFAFVSDRNFTIPKIELGYFDLREKKYKTMSLDTLDVEVQEGYEKEKLLDTPQKTEGFVLKAEYLYSLFAFIAGYFVAKVRFQRAKKITSQETELLQKVENAKNTDAILFLLALQNDPKFQTLIDKIEKKEVTRFKDIQKDLYRLIKA